MLGALHEEGWITAKARDELAAAYRFLRSVEHRLQMVADEQTQRLPSDPDALKRFAKFCGFPTLKAFETALCRHANHVQTHYALLFEEGPELAAEVGNLVFTGTTDDPDTLATLRRLGFRNPELAAETVRGWHFGRRPAVTSARAREVLTELTPALLAALGGTADPDAALAALDRAFGRMPAAVELMTILQSHDRLRLLFADLLGTAPRLAETVAQSPHVLDTIIDPTFIEPVTDERRIEGAGARIDRPAGAFRGFPRPHPRCRAPDPLPCRRAASVRRVLARSGRASLCGDRGRRHPRLLRGGARRLRGGARHGPGRTHCDRRLSAVSARAS